jgi:hypothetical protein
MLINNKKIINSNLYLRKLRFNSTKNANQTIKTKSHLGALDEFILTGLDVFWFSGPSAEH